MTKKARVLAALNRKAPILLFTGRTVTLAAVQSATYETHQCTACNTEVAFGSQAGDGMQPFCPACGEGTEQMDMLDSVPPAVMPQEDVLTAVACPHCSSNNVVEDRTVAALGGAMHCAACGNNIMFETKADAEDYAEDDAEPLDDDEEEEEDDDDDEALASMEASDGPINVDEGDKSISDGDEPLSGCDGEMSKSTLPDGSAPISGADSEMQTAGPAPGGGTLSQRIISLKGDILDLGDELREAKTPAQKSKIQEKIKNSKERLKVMTNKYSQGQKASLESDAASHVASGAKAAADAAAKATKQSEDHKSELEEKMDRDTGVDGEDESKNDEVTAGEDTEEDNDGENDDTEDDFTELDMSDFADEDGDVDVKMDEGENGEEARLLAFVAGVHTMTLIKADSGDNKDVFVKASFHKALAREAAKKGYTSLASYGFKGVKIRVPLKRVIEQRVSAALAVQKSKVTASLDNVTANFDQCAKIAATALTQNFYRNKTNPLQDTLVATLQGMGFKQAKTVVNRAMLQAAPQFVTAMLELAAELMTKSVGARNELSDSLTQMNPEFSNPMNDPDDDDNQELLDGNDISTTPEQLVARLQAGHTLFRTQRERRAHELQTASANTATLGSRLRALKNRN